MRRITKVLSAGAIVATTFVATSTAASALIVNVNVGYKGNPQGLPQCVSAHVATASGQQIVPVTKICVG